MRPSRSQPPPQAVQRHLRRRFIIAATWIPLVPTSNARSSTSSLSCCSVAQLLHLVEVRAFPLVSSSFELHGSLVPENIELADPSFLRKMHSGYIKSLLEESRGRGPPAQQYNFLFCGRSLKELSAGRSKYMSTNIRICVVPVSTWVLISKFDCFWKLKMSACTDAFQKCVVCFQEKTFVGFLVAKYYWYGDE